MSQEKSIATTNHVNAVRGSNAAAEINVSTKPEAAANATFAIRAFRVDRYLENRAGCRVSWGANARWKEDVEIGRTFYVSGAPDAERALQAIEQQVRSGWSHAVFEPTGPAVENAGSGPRFNRHFKLHPDTDRRCLPKGWQTAQPIYGGRPGFRAQFGSRAVTRSPKPAQPCKPEVREVPVRPVIVRRFDVCSGRIVSERKIYEPAT